MKIEDPISLLLEIHRTLSAQKIVYATYGGLALAAYGHPRFTKDADLAVFNRNHDLILQTLRQGFPRAMLAFEKQPFGGLLISRLTVLGEKDAFNTIDLVLAKDESFGARCSERIIIGSLRGRKIPIIGPEDFIVLKVLSTRAQDLEDAATVMVEMHGFLDYGVLKTERQASIRQEGAWVAERWQRLLAMGNADGPKQKN